jgi:acyl carrier protein
LRVTDSEIIDGITEIVRDALGDDSISLTGQSSSADFPEWDSFKHISIVVATEMRFGVKFQTAEIESLKNVGDFVALVQRKLAK